MSEIKFELADANDVKKEREEAQTVSVITDMRQRCSRCKKVIIGMPLSLNLVDVVDYDERYKAQRAVAVAMYETAWRMGSSTPPAFDEEPYETQVKWLRVAVADAWRPESFSLDAVGLGLDPKVRAVGIEEAKKWPAYTDRRKVFRVSSAKFPPGWVHLSFEARGSRDGEPVEHGHVMVHVCPECAPAVFDAACVDPQDPFGNGWKW